jgi:hypothetical protein
MRLDLSQRGVHLMGDQLVEELRRLNLTAQNQSWADRWLDPCLNALLWGIVLASILGLTCVLMRH